MVDENGQVRKGVTKGREFQTERKLRGDSRRNYISGMHRHAWCFKSVTNDEIFCATRSKEAGTEGAWTTSKDFTFVRAGGNTLPSSPPPPPSSSPSFVDLARISPSKSMAKPTGRSTRAERDKACAICNIMHLLASDKKIKSPWIGCMGLVKGRTCAYRVHTACPGFTKAQPSDTRHLDFYCDTHNKMKEAINIIKEGERLSAKRKRR